MHSSKLDYAYSENESLIPDFGSHSQRTIGTSIKKGYINIQIKNHSCIFVLHATYKGPFCI